MLIDGTDVCPNCQTEAERLTATQHVLNAIETEVARASKANTPPTEREAALIRYAMQLITCLLYTSDAADE